MRIQKHPSLLAAVIGLSILFIGCQNEPFILRGFYHWKSSFELSEEVSDRLTEMSVDRLYIRYFDVQKDNNGDIIPVSTLSYEDYPEGVEVVPVVYITNNVMKTVSGEKSKALAVQVFEKIIRMHNQGFENPPRELQIDCDWSETSRESYFTFLEHLKTLCHKQGISLSTTIRLHQVKYASATGIPNVDRGMLMFYNIEEVGNSDDRNSIYNPETASSYLSGFDDYPLILDIGLPAFSWVIAEHGGEVIDLINNIGHDELVDNGKVKFLYGQSYEVVGDTYISGRLFSSGTQLTVEEITPEVAMQAANQIVPYIQGDTINVILYHLDEGVLGKFNSDDVNSIYEVFE